MMLQYTQGGSVFFAVYSLLSTDIAEGDDDKPSIRRNRRKTRDLSKWDISTGPDRKSLSLRSRTCSAEGEPVRKPSVCSPTRLSDPRLLALGGGEWGSKTKESVRDGSPLACVRVSGCCAPDSSMCRRWWAINEGECTRWLALSLRKGKRMLRP